MAEKTVKDRIKALCAARGWTYYRLAKESGIPYSTLSTMLNKTGTPSVGSMEKLCAGFGVTLSQFFADGSDPPAPTAEQRRLLETWDRLTEDDRAQAKAFLEFLLQQHKK